MAASPVSFGWFFLVIRVLTLPKKQVEDTKEGITKPAERYARGELASSMPFTNFISGPHFFGAVFAACPPLWLWYCSGSAPMVYCAEPAGRYATAWLSPRSIQAQAEPRPTSPER